MKYYYKAPPPHRGHLYPQNNGQEPLYKYPVFRPRHARLPERIGKAKDRCKCFFSKKKRIFFPSLRVSSICRSYFFPMTSGKGSWGITLIEELLVERFVKDPRLGFGEEETNRVSVILRRSDSMPESRTQREACP